MSLNQRRTAFFAAPVAAALLLAGCTAEDTATETTTTQTSTSVAKATDVHWGYTAEGAPEHWENSPKNTQPVAPAQSKAPST